MKVPHNGWSTVTALALLAGAVPSQLPAQATGPATGPATGGAIALAHARRMLGHHKRVLMIGAHPDDEDTEVLTILARGEGAETAYLSLNRGEGGQNLIGPELGEGLGLIRSGELLSARALDGARQFFTRTFDYGFSKTIEEAWRFWPRDSVLKDVVRVVRRFRPQVIVAVFSGTPSDGHGQHQAAGWAAAEAFRVAGDSAFFPELEREEGLKAHTPLKLYRGARFAPAAAGAVLDGGVLDRAVGQSYRQIAMRSRSQHRSQDQGTLQEMGPSTARITLVEDRTGGGASLWAGIDTTPRADDVDVARHRARARSIEAGLLFDAIVGDDRIVPGQPVSLRLSAWNAGLEGVTIRMRLEGPEAGAWRPTGACLAEGHRLEPGTVMHCDVSLRVPANGPLSIPHFLVRPRQGAMYQWGRGVGDRGAPFEPEPIRAAFEATTSTGEVMPITVAATYRVRDQAFGEVRRPVQVVPRVGVRLDPPAGVWSLGGGARDLTVTLQHGASDTTRGSVGLEVPAGWVVETARRFELTRADEVQRLTFTVRAPAGVRAGRHQLRAVARTDGGEVFDLGWQPLEYPHITSRLLPRPAIAVVELAEIVLPRVARVGYIRGASDLVPEVLRDAGVMVELLDRLTLGQGDLTRFDVIVVGSRAYEVDTALVEQNPRLMAWVRGGGRLVVQYQQQAYFAGGFAPLALALAPRGHDRVTEEGAPVTVLRPDAAPFAGPNRITDADWDGWVQERGLYFARSWDPGWTPLLELQDTGDDPRRGGLLAATVGTGSYVYTGLSFFRQLPAAVPGALRLFLNLLEYRHRAATP